MNEKPILFNGDMVRAVLDGSKTQTRRVVKGQPFREDTFWQNPETGMWFGVDEDTKTRGTDLNCPYGKPGDRLWVRETWRAGIEWDNQSPIDVDPHCGGNQLRYEADSVASDITPSGHSFFQTFDIDGWGKCRPSIHMPRWASRITLEITDVRVERVQDISSDDAELEGIDCKDYEDPATGEVLQAYSCGDISEYSPRETFSKLWDSIYEKRGYGWDVNPWVWVVEFKRVEN